MKRLLSSLLCFACILGLPGSIVSAGPESPDGPTVTHNLPETVQIGQTTGDYTVAVDNLFPGEWVRVTVETEGPVWFSGPNEPAVTEGCADQSGTIHAAFFPDGLYGIYYASGRFTADITVSRTLLPDGSGPARYYDAQQEREITAGDGQSVPQELRFTCSADISRPQITHNVPETVSPGSTLNFRARLSGTAYDDGRIEDQPVGRPFTVPSVEITGGQAESDQIDESHTLLAERTLTFNEAGTVMLKIRYTPAVRLDKAGADQAIADAGDAVTGQYDEGDTLLVYLSGAIEEEITVEVSGRTQTTPESSSGSETGSSKPETSEPLTTGSKPETTKPKPETTKPKPETTKPEPETSRTLPSTARPESSAPVTTGAPETTDDPATGSFPPPDTTFRPPATDPPATKPSATVPRPQEPSLPPVFLTDRYFGLQISADPGVLPEGAELDVMRSAIRMENAPGKYVVYDIALRNTDAGIRPGKTVSLYIPIPKDYDRSQLTVYEVDRDGNATRLESATDGEYVRCVIDHFGSYALSESPTDIEDAGGSALLWIAGIGGIGILLLIGAGIAIWFLIFRRKPYRFF